MKVYEMSMGLKKKTPYKVYEMSKAFLLKKKYI